MVCLTGQHLERAYAAKVVGAKCLGVKGLKGQRHV